MAAEIASYFPQRFGAYHEPFLGGGAVLATLAPEPGYGSDVFPPLVEIWQALRHKPKLLKAWYAERWQLTRSLSKEEAYESIRSSYNTNPNGADLLFLSRACYGGVVRFRKADGYMSTPCGAHAPITPQAFTARVDEWHPRVRCCEFAAKDFEEAIGAASTGDLVYCDPPYSHTQAILYGAQEFRLDRLLAAIERAKSRGVYVALSIDGTKKSGQKQCDLPIPPDLFGREMEIHCGRSMLRRFQMAGESLEGEHVRDRLLLTY